MAGKPKPAEEESLIDPSFVLENLAGFFASADRSALSLLHVSPGVCTAAGVNAETCRYRPGVLLRRFAPADRLRLLRTFRQGIEEEWEAPLYLPDQSRRYLRIRSRLVPGRPAIILFTAADITADREYREEILQANRQLQELSGHLQQVREEERRDIAREIHDELGQLLTAAKMETYLLKENTAGVTAILDKALGTVRALSSRLRPALLDNLSLGAALREELRLLEKRTGLTWEFQEQPKEAQLPEKIATAAFRIVQEALTNTVRHADARRLYLRLQVYGASPRSHPPHLTLIVDDDGKGIPVEKMAHSASFGLMGMRERARSCGGTLEIRNRAPHGTRIQAEFPPGGCGRQEYE